MYDDEFIEKLFEVLKNPGHFVKLLRTQHGFKQSDIGERQHISRIENNHIAMTTTTFCEIVRTVLDRKP